MNDFTSASRLVTGLGVLVVAVGLALAVALATAAPRPRTRAGFPALIVLPSLILAYLP
jgi:hypothetical protein